MIPVFVFFVCFVPFVLNLWEFFVGTVPHLVDVPRTMNRTPPTRPVMRLAAK
jgi:hypothetical protein